MKLEQPIILKIKKIKRETPLVKTFFFDYYLKAKPGQFIMVWLPALNAKPFAVTFDNDKDGLAFAFYERGEFTKKLAGLKVGDQVGIFGPYGTFYTFRPNSSIIIVAGGYGVAPLAFLAEEALKKNCQIDFFIGAATQRDLLFTERLKKRGINLHLITQDGSFGERGLVTLSLEKFLSANKKNLTKKTKIFSCGPELMQKKVVEIAQEYQLDAEISLERYIKCGFGLCGQCVVDYLGLRMCQEGPVISGKTALGIFEFAKYHRDGFGRKIKL